jgi:hypothetical protein
MQWVEELPGRPPRERKQLYAPREETKDLHEHAAVLLKHPMRWAKYPRPLSERMARSVASRISEGGLAAYHPDKGFEAVRRGVDIYVRHNPDCADLLTLSYFKGYRAGVRDAVDKVRAGVWELRAVIAKIEKENGHADPAS